MIKIKKGDKVLLTATVVYADDQVCEFDFKPGLVFNFDRIHSVVGHVLEDVTHDDLKASKWVVKAINTEGVPVFYTGQAGPGWVSLHTSDAMVMTQELAERKAKLFNKWIETSGATYRDFKPAMMLGNRAVSISLDPKLRDTL